MNTIFVQHYTHLLVICYTLFFFINTKCYSCFEIDCSQEIFRTLVSVVLDWAVANETCHDTKRNLGTK